MANKQLKKGAQSPLKTKVYVKINGKGNFLQYDTLQKYARQGKSFEITKRGEKSIQKIGKPAPEILKPGEISGANISRVFNELKSKGLFFSKSKIKSDIDFLKDISNKEFTQKQIKDILKAKKQGKNFFRIVNNDVNFNSTNSFINNRFADKAPIVIIDFRGNEYITTNRVKAQKLVQQMESLLFRAVDALKEKYGSELLMKTGVKETKYEDISPDGDGKILVIKLIIDFSNIKNSVAPGIREDLTDELFKILISENIDKRYFSDFLS